MLYWIRQHYGGQIAAEEMYEVLGEGSKVAVLEGLQDKKSLLNRLVVLLTVQKN